jgi:hypothetical protein
MRSTSSSAKSTAPTASRCCASSSARDRAFLAEFYYREVLAHILKAVRARLARAVERGEIAGDELVRFPQLLGAPGIVAIVWSGLFDRFEPLDVRAMMRAYFDRLFGPRSPP